jgi:FlaA1/EpsC-like NDP-sugar epimerase
MALSESMSVREIIAELPKLSNEERELVLEKLVNLDESFEPTPAMSDAIREGLQALNDKKNYSAAELRSRIAAWTAR